MSSQALPTLFANLTALIMQRLLQLISSFLFAFPGVYFMDQGVLSLIRVHVNDAALSVGVTFIVDVLLLLLLKLSWQMVSDEAYLQ